MKTIAILASAAILSLSAGAAWGATITVDTTDDELSADADCSLREAVTAANTDGPVSGCTAGSGTDEIVFAVDGTFLLTIAGSGENGAVTGDLDVTEALTVTGNGTAATVIDGGGLDRVFESRGVDLALRNLTIQGGSSSFGGGVNHNGAGTLTLEDCAVRSNLADFGGGVNNNGDGIVSLARCDLSNNSAPGGFGGGLNNNSDGQVSLLDCAVTGNQAPSSGAGGGIVNNSGGSVTVERCVIRGNASDGSIGGGGIHNNSDGSVVVVQSEISENSAVVGAGVNNNSSGTISVTNSTISGNVATGSLPTLTARAAALGAQAGGGLRINGLGSVALTYTTVAVNHGGGIADGGSPGGAILESTLVVDNAGGDCSGPDLTSQGENVDSDGSCGLTQPSDMPSTDPLLEPLADYGGATRTHALAAESPVLDRGDGGVCPAADQRGVVRPGGTGCDPGAYEVAGDLPAALEVPTLDTLALVLLAVALILVAVRRLTT